MTPSARHLLSWRYNTCGKWSGSLCRDGSVMNYATA